MLGSQDKSHWQKALSLWLMLCVCVRARVFLLQQGVSWVLEVSEGVSLTWSQTRLGGVDVTARPHGTATCSARLHLGGFRQVNS